MLKRFSFVPMTAGGEGSGGTTNIRAEMLWPGTGCVSETMFFFTDFPVWGDCQHFENNAAELVLLTVVGV